MAILRMILALQPLLFGLGFLTPLTAQIIDHAGVVPPFGLSPLMAGLVVGGVLGGVANLRGSWI